MSCQGFFFGVSGVEIRPLSQLNLGDFFPNLQKKFPNYSSIFFQLSLKFILKIIEICFHRSLKNNKEHACLYFSRKRRSLQLPITFSGLNEQFSVRSANCYTIAPDKAAYCVFTQFCERENAIKFISVRTKTQ